MKQLSKDLNTTPASALYCLILALGNTTVLNGTTNVEHVKADWDAIVRVKDLASQDPTKWETLVASFKNVIGQPS